MKSETSFTFLAPSLILFLSLHGLIKLSCVGLYPLAAYSSLQCNNYQNGCISCTHTYAHIHRPGGRLQVGSSCLLSSTQRINQSSRFQWIPSYQNVRKMGFVTYLSMLKKKHLYASIFAHLFLHLCVCLVALYACVSHVQYLLPEYLARGAVCCLNKGSQSPALKRTFIKHFHSLHLFPLAKTDKLGRPRCHITLCTLSIVPEGGIHTHIVLDSFHISSPRWPSPFIGK